MILQVHQEIEISTIVPVYNSPGTLPELVQRIERTLTSYCQRFEIILVNDGSSNEDCQLAIERLCSQYDNITGIELTKNYGQHNALICGVLHAQYDIIATIDDDLQQAPEDIEKLAEHLLANKLDVVYGVPKLAKFSPARRLASNLTKTLLRRLMSVSFAEDISPFRIFRKEAAAALQSARGPQQNIDVLLSWTASKYGSITIEHMARPTGSSSNYSLAKLIQHAFNKLFGFSDAPLATVLYTGAALIILAAICSIFSIFTMMAGYSLLSLLGFVIAALSMLSGIQIVSLWVIGEYVSRLIKTSSGRPCFTIRTINRKHLATGEPEALSSSDLPERYNRENPLETTINRA